MDNAWGAAIGGIAGGIGGLVSGFGNARASRKAARQLQKDFAEYRGVLDQGVEDIEGYANSYIGIIENFESTFDPYDMTEAFNSLYEGVIQPMERDFDQNVLPGIQAAYSGGVLGAEAGLSGAGAEAKSNARQDLGEAKAGLRYQERGQAIGRNYQDYDRRTNLADRRFQTQTLAPQLRMNNAAQIFSGQKEVNDATLAADQSKAAVLHEIGAGIGAGSSIGGNIGGFGGGSKENPATPLLQRRTTIGGKRVDDYQNYNTMSFKR